MNGRAASRARRGCFSILAVLALGMMVVMMFVTARNGALDLAAERRAFLEGCAAQLVHSARAWSAHHGRELPVGEVRELPVDDLLSPGVGAELALSRVDLEGTPDMIHCKLALARGRESIHREFFWPVGATNASE